ncbi:MAG: DUF1007 family protein [Cardiobacteriaceae bacterium]|nr:DUF1007 family protein [Cardiobacteriaceae bacterium]
MKYLFLLVLFPCIVLAHPHQWIDLRITPKTDAHGALIALEESWEFDPYSSEILLQRNATPEALAQFKKDIDTFFTEQHGFTFSKQAAFAAIRDSQIDNRGGILRYSFTVPLQAPMKTLQFKVYETSYYMDVTYALDQPKQWDNGCRLTVREADPTPEEEELAASFDQNAQAPTGLGAVFAQSSELTCDKN